MLDHAEGRIGVTGTEHGTERVGAAEDVERQEAVVAVVAVEEAALLAAVHFIVGAVDVEHEAGRGRAGSGLDEQLGEQGLERPGVMADPVVPARLASSRGVFEPVQRTLAGQRRAVLAAALELAGEEAEHGVVAQVVVVVQILVAQGEAGDALGHERGNGVCGEARIAVVGEAAGDAVEQAAVPPDLPEQQRPRIGGDRPAVEGGRDFTTLTALKSERNDLTLCRHRSFPPVAVKFLGNNNLTSAGDRCLLHPVRNPG